MCVRDAACPSVAKSHMGIGNVYQRQGKYEQALAQHQKALEVFLAVYGQEHRTWRLCLKEAQGDLEEARSLFLECEQIYANVLGVDHEETLDAAMRAQTVGEEDEEESEEGEEDTGDVGLSDTS